jgi:two-component system, NtrC family, sensor histidine kinase PilS
VLDTSQIPVYSDYELLRVYTYYRTLLGSILLLMFQGNIAPNILGHDWPVLFFYTSLSYTCINIVTLVMLWRTKFSPSQEQLFTLLFIDLAAITLMMYASGGALGGLGYLLLVAVAAGSMLLRGQLAILLAAMASIAVVAESIIRLVLMSSDNKALFSAGSLGALLFITAISFQYLTKKVRTSHAEALLQAQQAAHLQKLAQLIVERMRTGIMVLNRNQHVELFNRAAANLLPLSYDGKSHSLNDIPTLQQKFQQWKETSGNYSTVVHTASEVSDEVKISFAPLGPDNDSDTLVFVEDNRAITQQAQQLKLASLGRLTASIAHEVRNPLGAISHAGQLLGESENLDEGERRLLEIINDQSTRVNQIIENVLQLSRRRTSKPKLIDLEQWLPKFVEDYQKSKNSERVIAIRCTSDDVIAKFDPGQMHQVLSNLCDNGLRYSIPRPGRPDLIIEAGVSSAQQPYIEVIDFGSGISEENRTHIFEPFFTTENTGSGLGLYICKELCEANQAFIHYTRTADGSSCFHIQLAHPERAV